MVFSINIIPIRICDESWRQVLISYVFMSLNIDFIFAVDLQSIPESLTARLLNVVYLDVHSNQIKSLPNSIGCLKNLKVLNVSGNLLESLPKTIEDCGSVENRLSIFT